MTNAFINGANSTEPSRYFGICKFVDPEPQRRIVRLGSLKDLPTTGVSIVLEKAIRISPEFTTTIQYYSRSAKEAVCRPNLANCSDRPP